MQFLDFIFLARSWVADRVYFSEKLALIGKRTEERQNPLTFIIFPEGTLVSADTKPKSKKYADKLQIVRALHNLKVFYLLVLLSGHPSTGRYQTYTLTSIHWTVIFSSYIVSKNSGT